MGTSRIRPKARGVAGGRGDRRTKNPQDQCASLQDRAEDVVTDGRRRMKTRRSTLLARGGVQPGGCGPRARARRCSPDAARWSRRPAERSAGPSAWASPQGPGARRCAAAAGEGSGGAPHRPTPQRLGMQRASCFPGLGAGSRSAAAALEENRGLRIVQQVSAASRLLSRGDASIPPTPQRRKVTE